MSTTSSERARRTRERQRRGARVVWLEVLADEVERLTAAGYLRPEDANDPSAVGYAVGQLLEVWAAQQGAEG